MQIGNGTFLNGDCLELMAGLPDGSVDMVLCDLPYGTTACSWDSVIPFEPLWEQYWRVCKPNAAVVLTASQPFTSALIMSQIKAFKYEWIWRKNAGSNFAQMKQQPMKEHESVLVFAKNRFTYNPIMQPRNGNGNASVGYALKRESNSEVYGIGAVEPKIVPELRYPSSIQLFNRERGLHPTQKPVALFEYLIRTYTNEGETVLDNTAGSGTTAIAAENAGRKWICMERDPDYYAAALGRVWDHV